MPDWIGTALRAAVALGLLTFVASRIAWTEFIGVARQAQPALLVAAILVFAADRLFMSWKWRYLLRQMGVPARLRDTTEFYFMGGLVALAFQWHLSGDIARAAGVSRRTGHRGTVIGSVVLEKLFGLGASVSLASMSFIVINAELTLLPPPVAWGVAAASVASFAAAPVLLTSKLTQRLIETVGRRVPSFISRRLSRLPANLLFDRPDRRFALWIFSALTILEQLAPVVLVLLLVQSFGLSLTPLTVFAATPPVMLFARLPVSLESLGVREGLFVYFLGLFGASNSAGFLIALAVRLVDLVVILGGAGAFGVASGWYAERGSLDILTEEQAEAPGMDTPEPARPEASSSAGSSDSAHRSSPE